MFASKPFSHFQSAEFFSYFWLPTWVSLLMRKISVFVITKIISSSSSITIIIVTFFQTKGRYSSSHYFAIRNGQKLLLYWPCRSISSFMALLGTMGWTTGKSVASGQMIFLQTRVCSYYSFLVINYLPILSLAVVWWKLLLGSMSESEVLLVRGPKGPRKEKEWEYQHWWEHIQTCNSTVLNPNPIQNLGITSTPTSY